MEDSIQRISTSPRSMAVLYAPWSIYAVRSRGTFNGAVERLRDNGISFVVLDEDSELTCNWLVSLRIDDLRCGSGAGTIIWLEKGRVVDYQINPSTMTVGELVARTRRRWT